MNGHIIDAMNKRRCMAVDIINKHYDLMLYNLNHYSKGYYEIETNNINDCK